MCHLIYTHWTTVFNTHITRHTHHHTHNTRTHNAHTVRVSPESTNMIWSPCCWCNYSPGSSSSLLSFVLNINLYCPYSFHLFFDKSSARFLHVSTWLHLILIYSVVLLPVKDSTFVNGIMSVLVVSTMFSTLLIPFFLLSNTCLLVFYQHGFVGFQNLREYFQLIKSNRDSICSAVTFVILCFWLL